MDCPNCATEMRRGWLGEWICPECNFKGICRRCEQNPVHPHREWQLCLDCICDLLNQGEVIDMKANWKAKYHYPKSLGD